jgi:hypothetical protein
MNRVTDFRSATILMLAVFTLLAGCEESTEKRARSRGWDLKPLHAAPVQTFNEFDHGAEIGEIRLELQHQMLDGREVLVQRLHSRGIVTGLTETVFDAATFEPIHVQTYRDSAGGFLELRIEYLPGEIKRTETRSFFGGGSRVVHTSYDGKVFDETQIVTVMRSMLSGEERTREIQVYRHHPPRVEVGKLQFSNNNERGVPLTVEARFMEDALKCTFTDDVERRVKSLDFGGGRIWKQDQ